MPTLTVIQNGIIKKIKDRTFYPQLFVSKIGERYGVLGQGIYIAILTFVLLLTCGLHTMFNSSPAILFAIVIVIPLWITFIIYRIIASDVRMAKMKMDMAVIPSTRFRALP